jgi:hypothetical protein
MVHYWRIPVFCVVLCELSSIAFAQDENPAVESNQKCLLFIGNSFTSWEDGIDHHLVKLAASAKAKTIVETDKAVKPGATLKTLHGLPRVHKKMMEATYDVVIVQGDIPEAKRQSVEPFKKYARLFVK